MSNKMHDTIIKLEYFPQNPWNKRKQKKIKTETKVRKLNLLFKKKIFLISTLLTDKFILKREGKNTFSSKLLAIVLGTGPKKNQNLKMFQIGL